MKKFLLLALILNMGIVLRAQTFSFEAGYGLHRYSMTNLNEAYINSYTVNEHYKMHALKLGQNYYAGIKYKPHGAYEVGLAANFQHGSSRGNYTTWSTYDNTNYQKIDVQALGFSISNTLYLSHLLRFQEKGNFLERFHIGLEVSAGVAFCKMIDERVAPSFYVSDSWRDTYTSRNFQAQTALKFQYDYLQDSWIASVGLKFGYQFLKTSNAASGSDDPKGNPYAAKQYGGLDFSGMFTTVFLTIGK